MFKLLIILIILILILYPKSDKRKFGSIKEIINTTRDSCNNKYNRVYPSGHIPGSRLIVTEQENEMLNQRFR